MEVDGVQTTVSTTFQFGSTGEHLIKFTLSNNTYVHVPSSQATLSDSGQFRNCPTIRRCYFPKSVIYTAQTFRGNNAIEYLNFPDCGLQSVGNYAFASCSKLTGDLEIPSLTGDIGQDAFNGSGFSRITNLGNVKTLYGTGSGAGCFNRMPNLIYAELPESLTTIQSHVFYHCGKLKTIVCHAVTPPTISGKPFQEAPVAVIQVPAESVETYKAASGWSSYANIISAIP